MDESTKESLQLGGLILGLIVLMLSFIFGLAYASRVTPADQEACYVKNTTVPKYLEPTDRKAFELYWRGYCEGRYPVMGPQ